MLNSNLNVTFSYGYGQYQKTLKCLDVRYFWRAVGDILEDIDFHLIEDYQAVRQGIRIKPFLTFNDSVWMANFLSSDSKKLTIDGSTIDVVNAAQDVDFELFEDTQIATTPSLIFLKKDIGIVQIASASSVAYLGKSIRIVR